MELDAKRLQAFDEMLAREEIRQCVLRYARAMDRHDAALVATVYHADAIDDHTSYIGLGSGLGHHANATHDAIWEAHQHYISNISIELADDTAHVESYVIVAGRRKGNTGNDIHGGRYTDRFEKRDGVWAIAARIFVYEWCANAEDAAYQLAHFPIGSHDTTDFSFMRPLNVVRELTE